MLRRFLTKIGWRPGFLLQNSRNQRAGPDPGRDLTKPNSRPRSGQGDPDTLCSLLASGKPQSSKKRDRPYPTPPVLRGKKRGKDGPEVRQLWGKLKEPKKDPFPASPARGYSALARPLQAGRFPGGGPRIRPANLASPRRAPLTPGTQPADFLFFFVSVPAGQPGDPLPGRQRPLSPAAAPAASPHLLPAPLTSPRLHFAPALLSSVPSFTPLRLSVPIIASGNNPRQRRGPRPVLGGAGTPDLWLQDWAELSPAQTRRPRALAWPWPGWRGRGVLAQAAGPEGGLATQPRHCPLAGGAASSPPRARAATWARARTWQSGLSGSARWASQRWTRACKPGDGKVASELEWRQAKFLQPCSKALNTSLAVCRLWKPHSAGLQKGTAPVLEKLLENPNPGRWARRAEGHE